MSRSVARVDPIPTPFALAPELATASVMHGRLVLLALPDDGSARAQHAELVARPGVVVASSGSRLFAQGLELPWHQFQRPSDVGLAPMLSAGEFLGALRGLADALFAAATRDGVLLDWSPEHATVASVRAAASVYPDATIVVRPELAAELPAETRELVTVLAAGDPAPPLPAPARPAVGRRADIGPTDSPLADRLIVVVGCGRSGTTWLEQLFLAHPRVGGVARSESWLFNQTRWLWANFRSGSGLADLVDEATLTAALRRYCDTVFTAAAARHAPGTDYFVEKTPAHSYRLPEIAAVYPDAWVVHLLRDGRDVARSISQVPFFDRPDPGDAAGLWQEVVTTIRRDAPATPRFLELRYEDVYADPVGQLTTALAWMGLEVDEDVRRRIEAAAGERVSRHAGPAGEVGPGSWRALPATDVARIYRRAGEQLVATGYARRRDVWRAVARAPLGSRHRHA